MKKVFRNNFWLLALSAIAFIAGFLFDESDSLKPDTVVRKLERALHKSEAVLEKELEKLSLGQTDIYSHNTLYEEKGIVLLTYRNDSLIFWTGNVITPHSPLVFSKNDGFIKLKTGWFESRIIENGNLKHIGLLLIKNDYPYQNTYLLNYFGKGLRVVKKATLHEADETIGHLIINNKGNELCRLEIIDEAPSEKYRDWLSYLFYSASVILLFAFLYNECENYGKTIGKFWPSAVYILALVALRFITIYLRFPDSVYSTDLFGPRYFADATSFWLPSLGDFLINSILFVFITYYLYKKINPGILPGKLNPLLKASLAILLFLLLCRFSWVINDLFVGLIRNSNIPFNINNLFSLTTQTYIGLSILGCIFLSFFFIAHLVIKIILSLKQKNLILWTCLIFAFIAHTAWCHLEGRRDLVAIMWGFVIILTMLPIQKKTVSAYPFAAVVLLVFWFSLYSVHTFLKHNGLKEYDLREAYAEKLSAEKDPVAEHLFAEIEKELYADTIFNTILKKAPINYSEAEKRLLQRHFSGYWEKYDISVSVFDSLCYPVLNTGFNSADNNFQLDNIIESAGEPTLSENLFYIPDQNGKINYLARIPLKQSEEISPFATMYIDFKSRQTNDEIGFPELLLDRALAQNAELKNYSYAKYKNGELVTHFGKHAYPAKSASFEKSPEKIQLLEEDGYSHAALRTENNGITVITKEAVGLLDQITTFSYLFAFYSLLLLLIITSARQFGNNNEQLFKTISFKNKLQVLLISIVLISLLLFGAGTIYFINKQFDNKAREIISEKIRSVQIEVQNKLEGNNEKNFQFKEYASYILKKFSNIFFTDITLYDNGGNFVASSSPKLFEEGLLSDKMNYEAYSEMILNGKTEFIHNESIGRLNYLSAYIPFTDKRGKVLGYLNLPYFSKQSELEKEISTFLVALINVYVLLFALTVLIAIFFSNYLTRPLRIIQEKMRSLTLGKANEFIEWKEKDEIGNLISEYNRMIVELSKSAELLARSERELAWREMAKQVAHEIKNPLTPMKLSIQHLKKIWKDKTPDIDEKVESVTKMLIEQIDTLSSIANEFSHFAKMPKPNEEEINIKNILSNITELYKDTVDISLHDNCKETDCIVLADKEQLLRVFNNLVKNGIQAIPEDKKGKIEINITSKKKEVIIAIRDNGTGINEHVMDKIFMPNFTTKTAGMGLGLAMVKNIIETSRGKIWFETTKNVGTAFFISLPLSHKE